MANILIIDDDQMICETLVNFISSLGHRAEYAITLKDGLNIVFADPFDLVFLDVVLPDGNGLEALPQIRKAASSPEVIIITGEGDPDGAELAIISGSWDYIHKPLQAEAIKLSLIRVLQYRKEKIANRRPMALKRDSIIGNSPEMMFFLDLVAKACKTDSNVLITGETGTGKELFARAIHKNSSRAGKPFVVVDCAALPENLVESMLFGHEKGAFTGAEKSRQGLIKSAHEGILFLDEVAELPMAVQGSFLRALQERCFRPVGGEREVQSDFRLIAATNRDPAKMVQSGKFRDDLFFRLQSIMINLPPLKKREGDINDLAFFYMNKFCHRYGIAAKGFSPEFLEALNTYSWPGNVRELINAIEMALSMSSDEHTLFPIHLPTEIRSQLARALVKPKCNKKIATEKNTIIPESLPSYRELIGITERNYFQDLVSKTSGSIQNICRISGLSRAHVYRLLDKNNIPRHP